MSEFVEYIKHFMEKHPVWTFLIILMMILGLVAAVGVYYFDWDLIQMADDLKNKIMDVAYKPFDRSYDDLKSTVNGWAQ